MGESGQWTTSESIRSRQCLNVSRKWESSQLTDVMYVPKLEGKLLSVSALTSRGALV